MANGTNIIDFTTQLGEAARPSQFRATINFPAIVQNAQDAVRASQLLTYTADVPASTVEPVEVRYRGRAVQLAGERSYAPWNAQLYNDINYTVRAALEDWSNYMRVPAQTTGAGASVEYKSTVTIEQLNRNGDVVRMYTLIGAFPADIQAINLDFQNGNQVESYSVTFNYDYFEISEP